MGWAAVFAEIENALAAKDEASAVQLFTSIPMVNMGGFLDLYLCRDNGHETSDPALDNDLVRFFHSTIRDWFDRLEEMSQR
jgi:hypothetical protein